MHQPILTLAPHSRTSTESAPPPPVNDPYSPPSHHRTLPFTFHPLTQNAPPVHPHLFSVFCFSASTLTSLTNRPFLLLTRST